MLLYSSNSGDEMYLKDLDEKLIQRDMEKELLALNQQLVVQSNLSISREIINYMNAHYANLSLKTMAEQFHYNPDYIGKLVKKVTGKNVKDLLMEQRLKQAKALLKNTDMPVTDIISRVGYSNATYFYKQFKNKLGITPDEYRRKG